MLLFHEVCHWSKIYLLIDDLKFEKGFLKLVCNNCAPLVADLFLFCYERDFMLSLSDNNQAGIIEAFNSTSRYLDELLNIDNLYFEQMVGRIYPT